jgi:hypothetical protein
MREPAISGKGSGSPTGATRMRFKSIVRHAAAISLALLSPAAATGAAEIRVMSSAAFKAAYLEPAAEFESSTGHTIVNAWGPSMGDTPQAIPIKMPRGPRGEKRPADVIGAAIMVAKNSVCVRAHGAALFLASVS